MSGLSPAEQQEEWSRSVAALAEIVGEPITVGSVPGGYYSESVARTAAAAGVRQLYTSEPTSAVGLLAGCQILGRYTIKTNTSPETAASLAVGRRPATASQAVTWKAKKAAKRVGGDTYLRVRARLLGLQPR
jgi:hypothetical protein